MLTLLHPNGSPVNGLQFDLIDDLTKETHNYFLRNDSQATLKDIKISIPAIPTITPDHIPILHPGESHNMDITISADHVLSHIQDIPKESWEMSCTYTAEWQLPLRP